MQLAIRVADVSAFLWLICFPLAALSLFSLPHQLRDRRLRRRGVKTDAVCEERIRRQGLTVVNVRCSYQSSDARRLRATISSPKPAPELGEIFKVVFDPAKPSVVVPAQYLASKEPRFGYFSQAALVLVAGTAALLTFVIG
ncbi:hypothetical protein ACIPPS_05340 [Streptomyces sp. NPDC090127]|uniref:hypothetical protein n=1 Tax=Streptomyces sp. NPDC090127 TaxID=3365953 RepID=UPI00382BEDDE